jgi:hypothetical protein
MPSVAEVVGFVSKRAHSVRSKSLVKLRLSAIYAAAIPHASSNAQPMPCA